MKKLIKKFLSPSNNFVSLISDLTVARLLIDVLFWMKYFHYKKKIVYYGQNPITFILLFLIAYAKKLTLVKVYDEDTLINEIINEHVDKEVNVVVDHSLITDFFSEKISSIRLSGLIIFSAYSNNLKVSWGYDIENTNYLLELPNMGKEFRKRMYEESGDTLLNTYMDRIESNIHSRPLLRIYSKGIHSYREAIEFNETNIISILSTINATPNINDNKVFNLNGDLEDTWAYLLYAIFNKKDFHFNSSKASAYNDFLNKTQSIIVMNYKFMKVWDSVIKEVLYTYPNQNLLQWKLTKWYIIRKVKALLKTIYGDTMTDLFIVNADLPVYVKNILRSLRKVNVVFLYGTRETGNNIASNHKKDNLHHLEYIPHNNPCNKLKLVSENDTKRLFIQGDNVAISANRHYIVNSQKEEDVYVNTNDAAAFEDGKLLFIGPYGTLLNNKETNVHTLLYLIEKTITDIPYVKHAISFEDNEYYYIGIVVDENYADKFNVSLYEMSYQLNELKKQLNKGIVLPKDQLDFIGISTAYVPKTVTGEPRRFIFKHMVNEKVGLPADSWMYI